MYLCTFLSSQSNSLQCFTEQYSKAASDNGIKLCIQRHLEKSKGKMQ